MEIALRTLIALLIFLEVMSEARAKLEGSTPMQRMGTPEDIAATTMRGMREAGTHGKAAPNSFDSGPPSSTKPTR